MSVEATNKNELMNIAMVMDFLHCSRMTLYRRCKNGDLPFVKVNRRILFRKRDLESWLDANTFGADRLSSAEVDHGFAG